MTTRICSKVTLKFNHWLPKLLLKTVFKGSTYCAITLGCHIYFSEKTVYSSLLTHELVHIKQIEALGRFKFYFSYFYQFIKNLWKYKNWEKAYYFISFEQEAYKTQALVCCDYLLDEEQATLLTGVGEV